MRVGIQTDHFVDANKMVYLGAGSQRGVPDMMLIRYACYFIAQNSDPRNVTNSESVRYTVIERDIRPGILPPGEDVKKVESSTRPSRAVP